MKTMFPYLFLLMGLTSYAQNITFTDPNFKAALVNHSPAIDTNNDGEIQVSEAQAYNGFLFLSNKNISNAGEINNFINARSLIISGNNLTSINVSANSALLGINVSVNNLTSLDLSSNSALTEVFCGGNNIASLSLPPTAPLNIISCDNNSLTTLDLSNYTGIGQIFASFNQISNLILPTSPNFLANLHVQGNQLNSLNVGGIVSLQQLVCGNNNLTTLELQNNANLTMVRCENNNLIELNIKNGSNASITSFRAQNNPNLSCIKVDDPAAAIANANWLKDATTTYSTDCGPIVTINNAPATTSGTFTVTFNIDRPVTGFDINDIVLSNATASNFATVSTSEYTADITPTSICAVNISIDVPASSMQDGNNIDNLDATQVLVSTADNVPPTVVTQNITVQLNTNGQANILPNDVDNGSSDNCPASITYLLDKTFFTCSDLGANTVTLTITDGNGNTNTGTAMVTVEDVIPPTVIAQNVTLQLDSSGQATLLPLDVDNGSIDNCTLSGASLNPNSFTCNELGVNTVTYVVTDASGNVASTTITVTIEENQPLTAVAQNITVQLDANGQATITPADIDNGSGSGCTSNPTLSLDRTTFSCSDIGNPITVTLTATIGNNSNSATAVVTVVDNLSPNVITQNITVQLDANGQAFITPSDIDNGSSDNCTSSLTTSIDISTFDCTDLGTNTITLTVGDSNNNTATGTALVTVEDNISPTAIAQNVTLQLSPIGQAILSPMDVDNGSSDNCSIANISVSPNNFTCNELGANTVTLTVEDVAGNIATATAVVTVEDNQPLTAVAQNITVQLDVNGQATITPTDVDNGSGSGCNGNPTLSLDFANFGCDDIGTITVTLTATEGNNSDSATALVTVEDNLAPTVIAQDITVQLDVNGQASITTSDIDNGSTDNCAVDSMSLDITSFDCSHLGANTVILTVFDVNNNQATATATVTVEDAIAPTVLAQDITVQLNASGQITIQETDIDNGSIDNCAIDSFSLDTSQFTCSDLGDNTVTLTATDTFGNSATATAIVTVQEDPNQTLTAIAQDITVQLDANGQVTIAPSDIDNGSGSGCNSTPTLSLDISSFDCDHVGNPVTVTLTAVEGSNSDSTTAVVTIEDNIAPTVITQDVTVQLDVTGLATITVSDIDNNSTDNCAIQNISLDVTSFDCNDLGDNTVTLTVVDIFGNSATETATVTVEDATAPSVVTQNIAIQLDADGQANIAAQDIDNGSADDCSGIASMSLDITSFDCPALGDTIVTLTVTDNAGNNATGTATVTIEALDVDNNDIADSCESQEIVVPKGFSPNGDNIGDTWVIENIEDFSNNKIQIFNRWGEKVFEATNYQNNWSGISNMGSSSGKRLPVGSYLYIIELNDAEFSPQQGWMYINY